VLREKSNIDRKESEIKVDLSEELTVNYPSEERESVKETTEDSENNAHSENIVEMCYNVIRIVESDINRRVGEHNTCKPTKSEKENETFNSKHRHSRRLVITTVNCS